MPHRAAIALKLLNKVRSLWPFVRSSALGEAFTLGLAGAVGQAIVLALVPIVTRLFTPEQFGVLGTFSAAVAILSIVAPLGYDQAIIGARSNGDAFRFVSLSIILGGLTAVLMSASALVLGASLQLGNSDPLFFVLVAATTVAAIAVSSTQGWYIRRRRVRIAGVGTFVSLSARAVLQVAAGLLTLGAMGLVVSETLGRTIALVMLDRQGLVGRALRLWLRSWRVLIRFGIAKRSFPIAQMPASTLEILLVWLPLPLVTMTYGIEWAGLVTLVQRMGTAPAALIGQSVVQIYYQRAASYIQRDRAGLARYTTKLFVLATLAFLPLWALVVLVGEPGFRLLFGEQWGGAGLVAAIWAPLVLVQILGQVAGRLLILLERQRIRLFANVALTATMVSVFVGAAALGLPFPLALAALVGAMVAINAAWIAWTVVATGRRPAGHPAVRSTPP